VKWAKWAAKALVAGATAFGGSFALAWVDGAVDAGEAVIIAVATITAAAGTFFTTNGPDPRETDV
jgi:hypothetical protein